jgi:hypothetical protein
MVGNGLKSKSKGRLKIYIELIFFKSEQTFLHFFTS